MRLAHQEVNEEQGVREAMMAVGDSGSCIQLLAPLNDESTIAKFLDRSGPGIQQMAYRVTDLERGRARPCASAASGCCTTAPARHLGLAGQLRPPQGRRRRARRAGRARSTPTDESALRPQ